MAEKELRKMNRTELIEIIYALQQNGKSIQQENEELRRQLEDKTIRIENAGSIAEAALSLNRIFEDAQAAAQQYLESVRIAGASDMPEAESTEAEQKCNVMMEEARQESTRLLAEAQQERERLLAETQQECERLLAETQQECDGIRREAKAQAKNTMDVLYQEIKRLLEKYPVLADYLEREHDE